MKIGSSVFGHEVIIACYVLMVVFCLWVGHENHTLTQTNAELARYVTHTLDSLEAVQVRLLDMQRDAIK